LLTFSIFAAGSPLISDSSKTVKTDTSFVKIKIPENEKELFKEHDYSKNTKSSFNPLTALIDYLVYKFFKNISQKNILIVRQIIIWMIVIIVLIIVFFILKKYGWGIPLLNEEKSAKNQVLFSDIDKPLGQYDFDKIIKDFIQKKDFRMAIRWLFIFLLFELEKKQHIRFEPHKTINDLKFDVKDKLYYQRFAEVCLIFEYVWYGKFDLDENSFLSIKNKIMEIKDDLPK
jgi:hypothetical protein